LEYFDLIGKNRLLVINNIKVKHPSSRLWALLPTSSGLAQLAMGELSSSPRPWEGLAEQGEEGQVFP
jgi:hypothetical protein